MNVMYVHISPSLTCAAQTLRCAEHIEAAVADSQRLLDAVRCGHLALMAALTEALTGSAGIGAYKDDLAAKHLEFMRDDERTDMPADYPLSFKELFKRVQEPDRLEFSPPLTFSDEDVRAVEAIDWYRGLIDHPKATHWSVEVALLTGLLGFLPALLERCVGAAGHRYVGGPDTALAEGVARIRAALPRVKE